MTQRLLLVNPRPMGAKSVGRSTARKATTRKGRRTMKRRTAAQKRATARMIAANRARARGARRAPTRARRRRVRRNPATSVAQRKTYARIPRMNPIRRRRRRAAVRRTARRVRRNPIVRGWNLNTIIRDLVQPAATGAVGAIANDALFTYLPLPAALKTPGIARYATKGISAVLLTIVAGMVVSKRTAAQMGVGALTTLTAEIARNFLAQNVPALAPAALEGMGLYTSGYGMGYYTPALPAGGGMGLYTPGAQTSVLPSLAPSNAPGLGEFSENGYSYS